MPRLPSVGGSAGCENKWHSWPRGRSCCSPMPIAQSRRQTRKTCEPTPAAWQRHIPAAPSERVCPPSAPRPRPCLPLRVAATPGWQRHPGSQCRGFASRGDQKVGGRAGQSRCDVCTSQGRSKWSCPGRPGGDRHQAETAGGCCHDLAEGTFSRAQASTEDAVAKATAERDAFYMQQMAVLQETVSKLTEDARLQRELAQKQLQAKDAEMALQRQALQAQAQAKQDELMLQREALHAAGIRLCSRL